MSRNHTIRISQRLFVALLLCAVCCSIASSACLPPRSALIMVDQFGYTPSSQAKVAVFADPQTGPDAALSYNPGATVFVKNPAGTTIHSAAPVAHKGGATHAQSGDKVWWYDFSAVTTPGTYYIADSNNNRSDTFTIEADVYATVRRHAVRTFYYQRLGVAHPAQYAGAKWADQNVAFTGAGQDTEARNVEDPTNAATARDLSGGWMDAGDANKYTVLAWTALNDLMFAYEHKPSIWGDDTGIPESGNGIPDILDEIKVELDWLRKMQGATGDGSVLNKVSFTTTSFSVAPPSADTRPRYWGVASTAATAAAAAAFAHGAILFNSIGQTGYGGTLETAAVSAYNWAASHPDVVYANTGFTTANPEPTFPTAAQARLNLRLQAAVYLYALTGNTAYRTFVDNNYGTTTAIANFYWGQYEPETHAALLYYTTLAGATAGTVSTIRDRKIVSISYAEFYGAVTDQTDAYRAHLDDGNYTWGSNRVKAQTGLLFTDLITYNLDSANHAAYRSAAAGYLHYLHGVNPLRVVYLSNMGESGAVTSVNTLYHVWFWTTSQWSNALVNNGPPPGYLSGGPNQNYSGTSPNFPYSPMMKAWRDISDDFPIASYELNEPDIDYQAAYIRFLSFFAP